MIHGEEARRVLTRRATAPQRHPVYCRGADRAEANQSRTEQRSNEGAWSSCQAAANATMPPTTRRTSHKPVRSDFCPSQELPKRLHRRQ
jgi:hypothetical protein